ncbi:MAG: lysophospholipase [Rhodospirillales bacterium]|nr:lysophospholipase [Rhodospirillales bacterium]
MSNDMPAVTSVEGIAHEIDSPGGNLFLWEKPSPTRETKGTVLFVHGSSMASTPTFDLQVSGRPDASVMNWFAGRGFDTWCFDCRGYGRSAKGDDILATISDGAEDAAAASEYIMAKRNSGPLMVYGISSGALRGALFAQRYPERVARLALDAMVWTGEGSPTLVERRKKLDQWRGQTRRPIDRAFINSIFTRDHAGTVEEEFGAAFADQILALDDSVPNGTYIDMCANLPVCDPEKISAPTLIMRGEFDGIAGLDDLLAFYAKLSNPWKEFTIMPGVAHASFSQKNYLLVYHILHGFFSRPNPAYTG